MIAAGDLRIMQNINGKNVVTLLKNVGHAPRCRTNLISLKKVQQYGVHTNFEAGST